MAVNHQHWLSDLGQEDSPYRSITLAAIFILGIKLSDAAHC